MNTTLPAIPADIGLRTGPRFLGSLLHWGLFGVLSNQVYLYAAAFRDPVRTKVVVYLMYALEVTQTVLITRSTFMAFVYGFGNMTASDNVGFVWLSVPLLTGIVAFLAEGFYAYRISILAQSYWIPGLVSLLAVVQLAGAIASSVLVKEAGFFSHLLGPKFYVTAAIWNGGSALCDIIIAVAMTYYLSKRGSVGMNATQIMLRRVITRVIEAGIVTAFFAIITLVLTLLPNHPTFYQVPSAILAKIYSNSMMVLLNSRIRLGTAGYDSEDHATTFRLRMSDGPIHGGPMENYELGENVLAARERIVFTDVIDAKNPENGNLKSETLLV